MRAFCNLIGPFLGMTLLLLLLLKLMLEMGGLTRAGDWSSNGGSCYYYCFIKLILSFLKDTEAGAMW